MASSNSKHRSLVNRRGRSSSGSSNCSSSGFDEYGRYRDRETARETTDPGQKKNCGIHISNLHKEFRNTSKLELLFTRQYGPARTCNIPTDNVNGLGLGYATIFFQNHQDATRAVQNSGKLEINGQILQVSHFVGKDEREALKPFTNLYVKNFAGGYKNIDHLLNLFRRFGPITSSKFVRNDDGSLKGYGFVCFANPEDAKRAVARLNNHTLPNGKILYVSKHESKNKSGIRVLGESNCTTTTRPNPNRFNSRSTGNQVENSENMVGAGPVGIKKLNSVSANEKSGNQRHVDPEETKAFRKQKTQEVTTSEDNNINIETESQLSSSSNNETDDESWPLSDDESEEPEKSEPVIKTVKKSNNNLYVKNFKGSISSDAELYGMFKIFGPIVSAKVMGDGFGYVCFRNPDHAKTAIERFDGLPTGNNDVLRVMVAKPKEERQKEFVNICRKEFEVAYRDYWLRRGSIGTKGGQRELFCNVCRSGGHSNSEDIVELGCGHPHCKQCLTNWLTFCIETNEIEAIHCQEPNCENDDDDNIEPNLIKALVGRKVYRKYDKLMLDSYLEMQVDIVYCEKCESSVLIDLDCKETLVNCRRCGWWFRPSYPDDDNWD